MGTVWGASWNFKKIIYENEFQNPQIFKQTISLFPEYSTLEVAFLKETKIMMMAICRPRKLAEGKFAPQKWHGMPIFKIAGYYKTYHVGAFLYYLVFCLTPSIVCTHHADGLVNPVLANFSHIL
jgi:hypothetical protein